MPDTKKTHETEKDRKASGNQEMDKTMDKTKGGKPADDKSRQDSHKSNETDKSRGHNHRGK